jgi:hypothetical protein
MNRTKHHWLGPATAEMCLILKSIIKHYQACNDEMISTTWWKEARTRGSACLGPPHEKKTTRTTDIYRECKTDTREDVWK